ncbi:MAG TPA: DUF1080 domain-containing protein [Puia sp.]
MKKTIWLSVMLVACFAFLSSKPLAPVWVSLFDGHSLNGWKVGENAGTFSVHDGQIVVHGPTAHLFYDGDYHNHVFTNFELKVEVMTWPGANSGIYFHTQYQEKSWPEKGFEVQVNNSHTDWKRTGSLYDVVNIKEVYVKDKEWFTEYIKVEGKHVVVKLNDKTVVDYTEPADFKPALGQTNHFLSSGTFALQGHDPNSEVHFKNIQVKVLD